MNITEEHIKQAIKKGACNSGVRWAMGNIGHSWEDVKPDWTLWAVGNIGIDLSKERLDYCAKEEPWYALEYAAEYLSKERLEECKKELNK